MDRASGDENGQNNQREDSKSIHGLGQSPRIREKARGSVEPLLDLSGQQSASRHEREKRTPYGSEDGSENGSEDGSEDGLDDELVDDPEDGPDDNMEDGLSNDSGSGSKEDSNISFGFVRTSLIVT